MTNFDKVKMYYSKFNEWDRLEIPSGKLEFELTVPIITGHLPQNAEILDLGGGPGRYTITLAKLGHKLHLADLSPTLLAIAKQKISELKEIDEISAGNIKSINEVNALDLSLYASSSFDAVLLFGPLYHLTNENERLRCLREVKRVLKPGGLVFAAFIPRLSGIMGIIARMFMSPEQVDVKTLECVLEMGVFNNMADVGFQEAYYPTAEDVTSMFNDCGFDEVLLRSVRGWGHGREAEILGLVDEEPGKYRALIELINKTACEPGIIAVGSHAVYVGRV